MKRFIRISFACVTCFLSTLLLLNSTTGASTDWPQWRGPSGQGVSLEKNLPAEWSNTKNIKWKTPIAGRGHSSPIVWGNKIFVTTAIEGPLVPGAKAVKHMDGDKEFLHPDSVGADHKQFLKVICVDRESGKILWEQTAFEGTPYDNRHRKSSFASSTPATDGKYVYAFFGSEGLYAYDMSGKLAWKADLGKLGTVGMGTGTSPVLYEKLVILQCDEENGASSFIIALDKKTGKEVWKTQRKVQVSWSTPLLVRTADLADIVAWKYAKGTAYVPSPILYGDYLYLTTDRGILTCLDARTGEVKYEGGRVPIPATFTASPIAFDGKILMTSEDGDTFVVRAGPKHEIIGTNSVGEPVYASPAVADGNIFIRGERSLYCIGS